MGRHVAVLMASLALLAADTFRGSVARTPAEAMKQVQGTPAAQIAVDLDASLDWLRAHPRVERSRVAALGFCFGGTQSMRMGTRRPDLDAVVIFYGSGPLTEAAKLGSLREAGPVRGIYGAEDGNIPVEQVRAFEAAMRAKGVENTVTVYPGVGHAFVKSTTYRDGGAAQQAWRQMVEFLGRTLKG